jgi:hypothetical protein
MTNFNELLPFTKEFRQLAKKYRSLSEDIKEFKRIIGLYPLGTGKHFNVIHKTDFFVLIKARLFCRYLKGAALRIVYAYHAVHSRVDFIEIYFKGDKENEDQERIKNYLDMARRTKK